MADKNFSVVTAQSLDLDSPYGKYCHWSEGLTMYIKKDGVTMTLTSEEIQELVKALPRTIGGKY